MTPNELREYADDLSLWPKTSQILLALADVVDAAIEHEEKMLRVALAKLEAIKP